VINIETESSMMVLCNRVCSISNLTQKNIIGN